MKNIDIVIRWVDGNDKNWISEKNKYRKMESPDCQIDASGNRYRDWELLKYVFRGIENNAPWVRKVFFITNGQKPEWLNVNNKKLKWIKHEDFIPNDWLPTFSSRTIDFNLFRIQELSHNFVLFDDDMFLLKKTSEKDFFRDNLPCDSYVYNAITASEDDVINSNIYHDMSIINRHFNKKDSRVPNWKKYCFKYGKYLYKNIVLDKWTYYLGFQDFHLPYSYTKKCFEEIWELEKERLNETCQHKFRTDRDLNHWVLRYWQLVNNDFYPRNIHFGAYFEMSDNNEHIIKTVENRKYSMICINEGTVYKFEEEKQKLKTAFEKIFHKKSSYEL